MLAERPSPLCFVMKGSSLPSFFFSSAEFCFSCWLFVLVRRSPRPPTPPATTHVRPGSYRDPPSPCPTLSPNGTCACGRARGCTERWESSAEFPKRSTSSSGFFFFLLEGTRLALSLFLCWIYVSGSARSKTHDDHDTHAHTGLRGDLWSPSPQRLLCCASLVDAQRLRTHENTA